MKALTLALVCLTLAAAACGGGDGPQSAGPVPTVRDDAAPPARPTSSPGSERVGFIGVPPVGATPSAPERGELVLHFYGRNATHARPHPRGGLWSPIFRVWVYADGRMIWDQSYQAGQGWAAPFRIPGVNPGFLEQRLTPEGVKRLRLEVVGLLAPSRSLFETLPPDHDPSPLLDSRLTLFVPRDYGSRWGSVAVRDGDRLVRLQWGSVVGKGSPGHEGTIATPEQLSALRRVDALLTDPASVLPSSAWADRQIRAYVPSQFAICVNTTPPTEVSSLLSLLPARAEELVRGRSWTRSESDVVTNGNTREDQRMRVVGRWVEYCSKAATEEARAVAEALSGLDRLRTWEGPYSQAYLVAEGVRDWEVTRIRFEPYFPHGAFPRHVG